MATATLEKVPFLRWLSQRWGVHADDHKRPTADVAIAAGPLPERLILPLSQHVGAAARPLVKVGERVRRGQLIAEPAANISAGVHAPTSGTVREIGELPMPHPSGLYGNGIEIVPDGLDELFPAEPPADPFALAPEAVSDIVSAAGVVGMGGATFPSAVKLALGRRSKIHSLVVNGSECEPYLSCDDRLMRERAAGIVDGIRLVLHATGATQAYVGIEDNKPEAMAAMLEAAKNHGEIRVVRLPTRYPMGSDRQLIYMLTGLEAPADGRAADVGVVVHNVGTLHAVHRAVRHAEPLTRRIVTVAGGAVRAPRNVEALIGTPISVLFEHCGGFTAPPTRLIMGGPMMGTILPRADAPIVKGTSGVLALSVVESNKHGDEGPCIRCGSCVGACPVGLLPLEMAARIRAGELAASVDIGLKDCIACGTCSFVCPSRIPLVHYFNYAKGELTSQDKNKLRQQATKQLAEERLARMEREAQEKAAAAAARKAERERAKAEAAAKAAAKKAAADAATQEESAT
ncbi:electron transport complex subunit RsxC [Pseudothauera rhizosphaerae]|uniref:Ion-translocating oxidoreductase complex subunit C n=1 Tax=Pseudothauera rhizosphaerae TaxID=2565932 RepID=A0A4S4AR03_9RHOO|nr:electron transport complex subunit RsxC [Pseudothauera rhizosphaerae]THF62210.1 electron transport complex subunit RsxC [Pseudothauera rhizosphaerae]